MKYLILVLLLAIPSISFSADTKITALTADTTPTLDDLTITVNDPSGTPANRKVTIQSLFVPANLTVDGTNVGVGTTATSKFRVSSSNAEIAKFISTNTSGASTDNAILRIGNDDGAAASINDKIGILDFFAATDSSHTHGSGAAIVARAASDWSGSDYHSQLDFETTSSGSTARNRRMSITGPNVGIGTFLPATLFDINRLFNVTSGGNVGVAVIAPTEKVDVLGTVKATTFSGSAASLTSIPAAQISGVIPIANLATGTPDGTKYIRDDGTLQTVGGSGTVSTGTAGYLTYYPSTGTTVDDQAVIYTDGTNVGLGSTVPGYKLDVNGTINTTGLRIGSNTYGKAASFTNTYSTGFTFTQAFNTDIQWATAYTGSARTFTHFLPTQSASGTGLVAVLAKATSSALGGTDIGINGAVQANNSSSTQNLAYGVLGSGDKNGAGTLTDFYGVYGQAASVTSGTITRNHAGGFNGWVSIQGGNIGIGTNSSSSFAQTLPPSAGMIIEGNVGIGSLTPGANLDVNGSIRSVPGAAVGVGACWCTTPPKVLGYCTGAIGTCSACNYNGSGC